MTTPRGTLLILDAGKGWATPLADAAPPGVGAAEVLESLDEAIARLRREPRAALLVDGPLLRIGSYRALKRLRKAAPEASIAAVEALDAPAPPAAYLRHGVQEVFFTPLRADEVSARLAVWLARERETRRLRERAREYESKAAQLERELPFLRLGELTGRERWVREFLRILSRVFRAETAVAVLPEGEEAELWVGGLRPAPAATLRTVIDRAKREFEGRWGGKPARYAAKHEGLGAAGQLEMTLEDGPLETAAFSLSASSRFLGAVALARPEPLTDVEKRLVTTCLAQAAEALERMLLLEELHLSRETYRLMIDRIEDFIFTIDGEMRIVQANRSALRRLGYRRSQLGKIGLFDIVAPEHHEAVRERMDRVLHREDFGRFLRVDLVPRDGKAFRAEVRATVMRRRSRRPMLIGVARDLTALEEWELRSYTDPITGLVNRAKFGQLLERELGRLTRVRGRLTLMMIDLDYFKEVNDAFGHSEGDRVLRELGDVLRRTLRHTDIPARWGGDEFAVMLPHTGTDQALLFAERLRAEARTIRPGGGEGPGLSLSIGIADVLAEAAGDPQSLINRADKSLYDAKGGGRDRVVVAGG